MSIGDILSGALSVAGDVVDAPSKLIGGGESLLGLGGLDGNSGSGAMDAALSQALQSMTMSMSASMAGGAQSSFNTSLSKKASDADSDSDDSA